ncbi:AMP-binding enzyme family protein [Mycobacterium xenopi 4042]|uniref:AMP-binding enzyme family protein n=1 Tax=Mycobacterium xenopi 4042 TaxID=1299334 RepID=X8AR49_MYCXE|nr:AMP-binding enzyme family protein [Mycobacterium xenopi 4042]
MTQLLASLDTHLPAGVWSHCHSLAFDVSVWEIFGALLRGGRLVVIPESVARSPQDLHGVLASERVVCSPKHRPRWRCSRLRGWSRSRWWWPGRRARLRWWIGGRRGG